MSDEALLSQAISKVRTTVLLIIGLFILYHTILHLGYTTDSCKWLLSHGRFVANQNWQPFGCLMYTYNKTDTRSCLRQTYQLANDPYDILDISQQAYPMIASDRQAQQDESRHADSNHYRFPVEIKQRGNREERKNEDEYNYFVIVGDTRMLQLYHYITDHLLSKLSSYAPPRRSYHIGDTALQRDLTYKDPNIPIRMRFLWRPFPNEELFRDINEWIMAGSQRQQPSHRRSIANFGRPKLLVVGNALWNLYYSNDYQNMKRGTFTDFLPQLRRNLTRLTPMLDKLSTTRILWTLQDPIDELLVGPLMNSTNGQIDELNYVTKNVFNALAHNRNFHLWGSSRTIASGLLGSIEKDGIHSNELVLDYKAQIIMNLFCNPVNNYDGTCCSENRYMNLAQITLLSLSLLAVLLACFILAHYRYSNRHRMARASMRWKRLDQQESDCLADEQTYKGDGAIDYVPEPTTGDMEVGEDSEKANSLTADLHHQQQPYYSGNEIRYLYSSGIDHELVMQLAQLGAILIYMFICDQTNFFMKENKYFTLANFLLPITYVFALGLFFTEQQQTQDVPDQPPTGDCVGQQSLTTDILNRSQTNEWKGWMQLVILIYNMSGASENLRIYMLIRVLLSSYLFITGYGHFTYFWETKDLSIKRLWKILFRLNLLAICLSVSMNRSYQSYYFISLVSIWFLIIFLFMSISPSSAMDKFSTNGALKMFIKFSVLLGVITSFYLSEVFIERIFSVEPLRPWSQSSSINHIKSDTDTDGSIQAWWLHWSVDRYSVPAGMIFAYVMWLLKVHNIMLVKPLHSTTTITTTTTIPSTKEANIKSEQQNQRFSPYRTDSSHLSGSVPAVIVTSAIAGILCYAIFASICQDRSACDEVHAYISFIPIVAFIILRNSTEFLRQRHSVFFAFFGHLSLETSLCQYHIWLAAGTYGILVLVPSYPTLNLVITSLIFITASHKLNSITGHLIPYCAQADDWRSIIRNMIVFLLIVAPMSFS